MLFCRCPGRIEFAGALARPRLPSWPQAKENLLNGHAACHQSKARDPVGVPKVTVLAECMRARPCGRAVRKSAQRAAGRGYGPMPTRALAAAAGSQHRASRTVQLPHRPGVTPCTGTNPGPHCDRQGNQHGCRLDAPSPRAPP